MINYTTCAVRENQTRHYRIALNSPFTRRALLVLTWSRFDATIPALRIRHSL